MECVDLLGQGRPVSQIQLATARLAISFLSNMECVNLLGQGMPDSQIHLATTRVAVCLLSNMKLVNLLDQGSPGAWPDSQIPLATAGVPCLLQIKYGMSSTFLARVEGCQIHWLQPGACLLPIKYAISQPSWSG
ncbi:hypothetical protein CEXT_226161 [Caerostris extrusa]|uniref:Uncharacterized protein n=1 Tax=Caerostris extrusa TaxID=172846 RepID=A0AAV4Y0C7_CAEEX|nr:hypothetical protein CEXT_226161 [Caerostris extrusa]